MLLLFSGIHADMKGTMKQEGKPAFCCSSAALFVPHILAADQNLSHFLGLHLYSARLRATRPPSL